MDEWFGTTWQNALAVALGVACVYVAIIVATRIAGLRSFAKMSSFDFAMTVAIGTLIGSIALTRDPPVLQGLVGVAVLYLLQWIVARLRLRFEWLKAMIDNRPVLLIEHGRLLEENLRHVRVTHEEVHAAVRAASVARLGDVRAAIMETTGDISVIAGSDAIDPELLRSVRRSIA